MPTQKRLGEILIESNIISQYQLEEALKAQKKSGKRLGKVLVEMGFVSEQDIINVLEFQLGIKQVKIFESPPDKKVLKYIPKQLARSYQVIPYREEEDALVVAMADPLNVVVIDDLRLRTGKKIKPVIATEEEINKAVERFYGLDELDGFTRDVEVSATAEVSEEEQSEQAPVIRVVNSILEQAVEENASDVHLEPGEKNVRIRFRVDGVLREIMTLPLSAHNSVVSRIKILAGMDIAEKRLPQDGRTQHRVKGREIDIRVSSLPTVFGEKIVLRLLDRSTRLLKMEELGFSREALEGFRSLFMQPYGMVLVTGPTGSGKTTTLYAALSEINSIDKNIVTIEDPVEYVLTGINQVTVNPKAGLTFAVGLRSILRQDPDVIMIGEIRDVETAKIAVRAANTGHLVLSTLHTNDAPSALTRLMDMGVEPYLVASSVVGVLAQRLVRKICTSCKQEYYLPADAEERVFLGADPKEELKLFKGSGCRACGFSGYRGRMAVTEVLKISSELRKMIMQKAHSEAMRQYAHKYEGFISMRQDGIEKARAGLTSLDEVMRNV